MNELSQQTSPYLLQHAANPVHWKAWSQDALNLAKQQNKLIIISVGYAACHWCHVMEHETFEDEEAAAVMNQSFINIKVDREERPDVDAIYMKALQLMTKHGGWPMNVVALPDGRPVWGGTYFRKNDWMEALTQLQALYVSDRKKVEDYASKLHESVSISNLLPPPVQENHDLNDVLSGLVEKWKKSFDPEFGGYARAPKFMLPDNFRFLLRYAHLKKDKDLLSHVKLTLDKMALGGLFDTVGGGFARYSVDMKWHVPHFEKMLYDNGLLIELYAEAYQLTRDDLYLETIRKTASFILSELTAPDGSFYTSLDADSLDSNGHKHEGAFYVWQKKELEEILGDDFQDFASVFHIDDFGHWENGNFVLIRTEKDDFFAHQLQLSTDEFRKKRLDWEQKLYKIRKKRPAPALDNKHLASWNAMMVTGFVSAYKATGASEYLESAMKAAHFLNSECRDENGRMLHVPKSAKAKIEGFLDDYVFTIKAFLSIYEVTFEEKWLLEARQLLDFCLDAFYDQDHGYFRFNASPEQQLVSEHYEMEDNVIPASNSVLCGMLYKLGRHFENPAYVKLSERMMRAVVTSADYPSAFSHWFQTALDFADGTSEVVVTGSDSRQMASEIQKNYLPDVLFSGTETPSELPLLKNRYDAGKTQAFICRKQTCSLPMESAGEVLSAIRI